MTVSPAERLDVLLVDDDRAMLRTLADILRLRGYEPRLAGAGGEALTLVETKGLRPALALIDLKLPDIDGMQVVQRLRAASPATEVVVLTAHASVESAVGALRQQSCDYLIKPIAPEQLLTVLGRAAERWLRRRAEEALQRGEERFRRLIEGIGDMVLLLDADLRIEYASPSVARILGIEAAALLGRPAPAVFTPADGSDTPLADLLVPGAAHPLELRAQDRGGQWRSLQVTVNDLRTHPGLRGLVLTARDVTEQRVLERQALQVHRLDSIGRLAGGVAHDFNNILSVVLGAAEMALHEAEVAPRVRTLLNDVRGAGERGARLTRQLLQFAKRQPAEPTVFALRDLVFEMTPLLRRVIGENVELVLELGAEQGFVRADATHVEQILMNLVVNARDAMPAGGRLGITLTERSLSGDPTNGGETLAAGSYVVLAVSDTGTGMSEAVRARALEPFFTTKEPGAGTGLGLSICYGLTRQAGGVLRIESTPGQGTVVEALFATAPAASTAANAEVAAEPTPQGTETILLVEDDVAVREVSAAMLTRLGYRVLVASEGNEALELLRAGTTPVDLLVTDVVMPRVSGPELVQAIRRIRPRAKALYVSGYPDGPPGEAPAALGPLLAKPFSTATLARAVRAVLDAPVD